MYFSLLSVLVECDSNDCEALADADHTVYARILNPYVSANGFSYDGAPGGPDPDPDSDPIPEPTLVALLAGGVGAAFVRRSRIARGR